ncbi:MAG: hydrogenase maturation protein [Nitrosomonas sp.]|uniref:hydrogenase maturation protein n=1 Tax=Nitrosomonas sp. TaxID=42353 RepID=UPI001E165D4D|nr:hydrogenase maturation protein [Nitrosomonas sp.]MBX9894517.1 hydrogenase maturation protein [Nitrosomonas sp.]
MKILILTHSFNCLTQRLFVELQRCGYELSIEFDINDAVTCEAVELFNPDLILAPFLKRRIPENIWRTRACFIVHPGITGDRGPSALDWAIMKGVPEWGVTVLQANAEMDAGDIWASEVFPMRLAPKSSLYRHEIVGAATRAVLTAITRFESRTYRPMPLDYTRPDVHGNLHAPMRQIDRCIDWQQDNTLVILRKVHAADGSPGVLDSLFGEPYYLYDAHHEKKFSGKPGAIIAKRDSAICRATIDGAVWIGHVKHRQDNESTFKLAASSALQHHLTEVPEIPLDPIAGTAADTYQEIWFEKKHQVGYLHFAFYNGAMDSGQCQRLREVYLKATSSDIRVIVLMGGPDFWSNGIHLNHIEHADSPADESWRNINAMNDLVHAIITTERQFTIAALQGNAGAGGVFLSLAADYIYANARVILNPHYKSMGNLYGSEYWTYLLPRRVGSARAYALTQNRLPIGAAEARNMGLINDCFTLSPEDFRTKIVTIAETLAAAPDFPSRLQQKIQRRQQEEHQKPLHDYRNEELQRMQLNFYGFDPSYHVARYHFVHKIPYGWTPRYLARHRRH